MPDSDKSKKTKVNGKTSGAKVRATATKKRPLSIKGTLVALGGGDDDGLLLLIKNHLCTVDSHIEVITTATREPTRSGKAYVKAFKELGCGNADYLPIDETHPADDPKYLKRLERATVVFFTGGDQMRLSTYLTGTEFLKILQDKLQKDKDFVVAGTSAGACAMSNMMIYEGYGRETLLKDEIKITGGLGFVKNLFIDTHFTERGRFGRLAQAVARHPTCLGVGLGEETGVMVSNGNKIQVFGSGNVTIMDGSAIKYSNLDEVDTGEPIAVEHLIVHFLPQGHEFEIEHHSYKARLKGVRVTEDGIAAPSREEEVEQE